MKHDSYLKYLFILFISLSMISGCRENQPGAELSLASPVINIPQSGGYVDFNIFTNTSWHIDNPEGFSLSPLSGKGSTTVRLTTEPNNQVASVRSGVFTVVGEENLSVVVTVTQPGIAPVLTVSPQQIEASWSQEVYALDIVCNFAWEASSDAQWCQVSPASGDGNGVLLVSASENSTSQPRTAVISLGNAGLGISRLIPVNQEGYVVNPRMLDSLVLVRFFTETGGSSWQKDKWDLASPIDTWTGIRLNTQGRVDSLSLASGVISQQGIIPDCIGELTDLVALSLGSNSFTGPFPESVRNLKLLRRLNIGSNPQVNGPIPEWIGELNRLERLSLGSMTGLTGSIPASIGQLVNLTDLNLVGCSGLSGSIPPEIGNLVNLKNIQLNNVPLTGTIPPEFGRLASLENLGLYNTKLSLPIPDEFFDGLTHLSSILFHQNANFNGPLPEGLGRLTTTSDRLSIRLENCNFTGTIPESWVNIPIVSTQLRLQGNRLSGTIPELMKQHTCWNENIWKPSLYICPQQVGYGFTNCD